MDEDMVLVRVKRQHSRQIFVCDEADFDLEAVKDARFQLMQDRATSDILRALDESLIDVLHDHSHQTLDGFSEAIILGSD